VFSRNDYCGILNVTYSIETRVFDSRNCLYSYFTIVTDDVRIFVLNRLTLRYRDTRCFELDYQLRQSSTDSEAASIRESISTQ